MPTGDAARIETGDSYVARNLFGHEEWIFNFEWIIGGFRYGFLQPINKYYQTYSGQSCSILLYTLTPELETLLIGKINNAYVPGQDELSRILKISTEKGWVDNMRNDVKHVKGNLSVLEDPEPKTIANIRFRPEDVNIFDPRQRVIGNHKIVENRRYQPFDWNDCYPEIDLQPSQYEKNDPKRSEKERTRAAQEASRVDPKHIRLQNLLYEHLCNTHRHAKVCYEQDFVDLTLEEPDRCTFFEIKMEPTAKRCIRKAMGQLLEYAHYHNNDRARRLVIVGDVPATECDRSYMAFLRKKYNLPIYYSRFLWESAELSEEI